MARDDVADGIHQQEDYQVAYVFDPEDDGPRTARPTKRRRTSKRLSAAAEEAQDSSSFVPLLNGAEKPVFVQLRETLYQVGWSQIDDRIQGILRDSYRATLDEVSAFVDEAKTECVDQLPCAFVITGPNIASQDLLFQQLSETLQVSTPSKFVRLRSSEASTLKATLKKIIRDVTAKGSDGDDDDDLQVGNGQDGRRYLDYDLEALHAFIKAQTCEHVFVAFQDSEGFDSSLLSELIVLFNSWRPRIPFNLLFGIATSVELLQGRLLKSACQLVYGAQFDVIQSTVILETVFKAAVAAADVPVRLGPSLLRSMLNRQHDQVAGVQTFIMALKYAYMCHFYANPLSVLLSPGLLDIKPLQTEHIEAIRNAGSFQPHVERAVENGTMDDLRHARSLIEEDSYLLSHVRGAEEARKQWINGFLRCLLLVRATGAPNGEFSQAYVDGMEEGIVVAEQSPTVDSIRRMDVAELVVFLRRAVGILEDGDAELGLGPSMTEQDIELQSALAKLLSELETLQTKAEEEGLTLRSKYSGQSKVMRTTVIAQRVQLSQDSAALTDEDKQLTAMVDQITTLLVAHVQASTPSHVLFCEGWLYDSRIPSRDVFVPRPRAALERSLTQPHDYLEGADTEAGATLPATCLLYRLYLETGSLINVADLWSAYVALVGGDDDDSGNNNNNNNNNINGDGGGDDSEIETKAAADERRALVQFYRGLAELRALGFVKASKKKVDHVAKLKWL